MKKILTRFNGFQLYLKRKRLYNICKALIFNVENIGVEPMTSCMPSENGQT
ncbi:MAG: hypothetical protein JWP37_1767 [Mucilaginibacter sp.]|nr:hypothetical protein [Mucilaginibacter sp.]